MSDGDLQKNECQRALNELYAYLDQELTEETRASIAVHIEECGPCINVFDFHQELKQLVARCCTTEVPSALKAKILTEIQRSEPGQ